MKISDIHKDDVFWAKTDDRPWWPAAILSDPVRGSQLIKITLLGEKVDTTVKLADLCDYKENYEMYAKTPYPDLKKAIQIANKFINGLKILDNKPQEKIEKIATGISKVRVIDEDENIAKIPEKSKTESHQKKILGTKSWSLIGKRINPENAGGYIAQLAQHMGPEKIVENLKQTKKCLKSVLTKKFEGKEILESKIGLNLAKLIELCKSKSELKIIQTLGNRAIKKLKEDLILECFGENLKTSSAKMPKKDEQNFDKTEIKNVMEIKEKVEFSGNVCKINLGKTTDMKKLVQKDDFMQKFCENLEKFFEKVFLYIFKVKI